MKGLRQDSSVLVLPRITCQKQGIRADITGHSAGHGRFHSHYSVQPGILSKEHRGFKDAGFVSFADR